MVAVQNCQQNLHVKDLKMSHSKVTLSIVSLIGFLLFIGLFYLSSLVEEYQNRYIECTPEKVLPVVERAFYIDFPEGIRQVRTAKRKSGRIPIDFIIKFAGDPKTIERFLKSFPEEVKFELYSEELDQRISCMKWFMPKWFRDPIKAGKIKTNILVGPKKNLQQIYIDTTNKDNFAVYIQGFYEDEQ